MHCEKRRIPSLGNSKQREPASLLGQQRTELSGRCSPAACWEQSWISGQGCSRQDVAGFQVPPSLARPKAAACLRGCLEHVQRQCGWSKGKWPCRAVGRRARPGPGAVERTPKGDEFVGESVLWGGGGQAERKGGSESQQCPGRVRPGWGQWWPSLRRSRVAQRERAGPITQRSMDRNHPLLGQFFTDAASSNSFCPAWL